MWRLREYKMHDRSHAVIRLPVHLQHRQRIFFEPGQEEEAVQQAMTRTTELEAWFILNQNDTAANDMLYVDIPYRYVFTNRRWQVRQRGGEKIIARMFTVGIRDEERYYLRLLLLHVKGATSFAFLRTVNDIVYESYKEAAFHRHLLDSDEEWDRCLSESATFRMPREMRETFAYICCFCFPTNILQLWIDHSEELSLDYRRRYNEDAANNFALHDIEAVLKQHGLSCAGLGLPTPTGRPIDQDADYDVVEQGQTAAAHLDTLNPERWTTIRGSVGAFIWMVLEVLARHFCTSPYCLMCVPQQKSHYHLQLLE